MRKKQQRAQSKYEEEQESKCEAARTNRNCILDNFKNTVKRS